MAQRMNEQELISNLKSDGYDNVYVWNAEPNEDDQDHNHLFDTKIIILDGEIWIEVDGTRTVFRSGDEVEISRGKIHSAVVGSEGCKYIVAERH